MKTKKTSAKARIARSKQQKQRVRYLPPNKPGWWARLRMMETRWFYVFRSDEKYDDLNVRIPDFNYNVGVEELSDGLTCWFGPVELPWNADGTFNLSGR